MMQQAADSVVHVKGRSLIKKQALLSGILSLFAALIYFAVEFPFPRVIATVALTAAAAYLLFYLFFDVISRFCYREACVFLSVMGVAVLTMVINFSGGIVSPFVFFYFCILISEALYGLENKFTLPVALAGYLAVVGGQFFGLLSYDNPWAREVYGSNMATLLIGAVTAAYMVLTRHSTKLMMRNLRAKIEQEEHENEGLLRKFSELNSTSQIGVLAHRIAHDLRGPISSISGYIQIEMVKEHSPEDAEALKELNSIVDNMDASLKGITRFGKAQQSQPEMVRLADFMRSLKAIISYSPQAVGVEFKLLYNEKLPAAVMGSRADLQQACFNILKNAVEAVRDNPDRKVIELDLKVEAANVRMVFADNGPGILPELLSTMFRKSITTKKDGTGVGLIITRDLLVRNGGDLKMRNREAGGLEVSVMLPLAQG